MFILDLLVFLAAPRNRRAGGSSPFHCDENLVSGNRHDQHVIPLQDYSAAFPAAPVANGPHPCVYHETVIA
jgi:hypothetical protein